MSLFTELSELMGKYSFRPNRKLSQNFLVNENALQEIISLAELNEKDSVLEIGAGTGFLTRELSGKCNVIAFEADEKLCNLLWDLFEDPKVKIQCGDFLKAELPEFNKVVSVPPYHISKKIMQKLLEKGFEKAVIVFQEEFAEKLVAEPGFPQYSALTVLCSYKTNARIVKKLSPASFFPKPKTNSAIIVLEKTEPDFKVLNEKLFSFFVIEIFRYRKKNLANALLCSENALKKIGLNKKEALPALKEFDLEKKVDLTSVREFVEIFNALYSSCEK